MMISSPALLTRHLPPRILVVDDDPFWQSLALATLQGLGYQAEAASSGPEALSLFEQTPFDIILMDIEMPLMSGLEVTHQIRADTPQQHQPYIVAITSQTDAEMQQRCTCAGVDAHLGKPVWPRHLFDILQIYFSTTSGD